MSQKEKIRICFIGCGRFCRNFIPLFKAHPSVEKVYVCDLIPERAKDYAEKFEVEIIDSFEEAIASDKINSVAIFTQRYTHGDLVIAALKAGKNYVTANKHLISHYYQELIGAARESGAGTARKQSFSGRSSLQESYQP